MTFLVPPHLCQDVYCILANSNHSKVLMWLSLNNKDLYGHGSSFGLPAATRDIVDGKFEGKFTKLRNFKNAIFYSLIILSY